MKRHPIDPLSFVLGTFFLVTGLVFAFGGDASKLHIAWFWPVVLGVTGLGLMLLTVRAVRPERQTVAAEPVTGADGLPSGAVDGRTGSEAPGAEAGFATTGPDEPAPPEAGAADPDR